MSIRPQGSQHPFADIEHQRDRNVHPCRFLVPAADEEEEVAVGEEEEVDEAEEVVGVPEGVEAGEAVEGPVLQAAAKGQRSRRRATR